jgi:hypothetical protein
MALLYWTNPQRPHMLRRFCTFQNDECYEIAIEILTIRIGKMGSWQLSVLLIPGVNILTYIF